MPEFGGFAVAVNVNVNLSGLEKLNELNNRIQGIQQSSMRLGTQMETLNQQIQNAFSVAGVMIFARELEHVLNLAGKTSDEVARFKMMGFTPDEIRHAQAQAFDVIKAAPVMSLPDVMMEQREVGSVFGQDKATPALLKSIAQLSMSASSFTGEDNQSVQRALLRAAEARGNVINPKTGEFDPQRITDVATSITRGVIASGGNISMADMMHNFQMASETTRRFTGPNDRLTAEMVVLGDQFKGQAGFMFNQMERAFMLPHMSTGMKSALLDTGLLDTSKLKVMQTLSASAKPGMQLDFSGVAKGLDLNNMTITQWLQSTFLPRFQETFEKQHGRRANENEVSSELLKLFSGNTRAERAAMTLLTQQGADALEKVLERLSKMPKTAEELAQNAEGFSNAVKSVSAAFETMAGVTLAPTINAISHALFGLADVMVSISQFAQTPAGKVVIGILNGVMMAVLSFIAIVKTLSIAGRTIMAFGAMLKAAFGMTGALLGGGAAVGEGAAAAAAGAETTAAVAGTAALAAETGAAAGGMAMLAARLALLPGPIGLVVGVGTALYFTLKTLNEAFPETMKKIRDFGSKIAEAAGSGAKEIAEKAEQGQMPGMVADVGGMPFALSFHDTEATKLGKLPEFSDLGGIKAGAENTVHAPETTTLPTVTVTAPAPHNVVPHPQPIIRHTFTSHGSLGLNHPVAPSMVPFIMQREGSLIHPSVVPPTFALPEGVSGVAPAMPVTREQTGTGNFDLRFNDVYVKTLYVASMIGGARGSEAVAAVERGLPSLHGGRPPITSSAITPHLGPLPPAPPAGPLAPDLKGRIAQASQFLMSQGFSAPQTAGIVGNLIAESDLNPNAVNRASGMRGIAQWDTHRRQLFSQVFHHSIEKSTLQEQLQFLVWEMRNTEAGRMGAFNKTTTAPDAAAAFNRDFERSGVSPGKRIQDAMGALNIINNLPKGQVNDLNMIPGRIHQAHTPFQNDGFGVNNFAGLTSGATGPESGSVFAGVPKQQQFIGARPESFRLPPPARHNVSMHADIHLDGERIAQHTFKNMFDNNPAATPGPTGFDQRMSSWLSGVSIPI